MIKKVKCEQFNVNDDQYKIIDIFFSNGDFIGKGELLFVLDSSKAAIDINAESEGFFYTVFKENDTVSVNSTLYVISEKKIEDVSTYFETNTSKVVAENSEKVITEKASELIASNNIDISFFEEDFITVELVNGLLNKTNIILENSNTNKINRLAIIGAGQGLIQVLDIVFKCNNYLPVCIYDDTPNKIGTNIFNIPVKGPVNYENIVDDFHSGIFDVIINSVSTSIEFRKNVFEFLNRCNVPFANLIHPKADIGFNVKMGAGNIILSDVTIGACTSIGNDNFISAKCNIEHHNIVGNHVTFGPCVITSGSVTISDEIKFGTGIFIEPKINIGKNSIISSGSIIVRNILSDTIVSNENLGLKFKSKNNQND